MKNQRLFNGDHSGKLRVRDVEVDANKIESPALRRALAQRVECESAFLHAYPDNNPRVGPQPHVDTFSDPGGGRRMVHLDYGCGSGIRERGAGGLSSDYGETNDWDYVTQHGHPREPPRTLPQPQVPLSMQAQRLVTIQEVVQNDLFAGSQLSDKIRGYKAQGFSPADLFQIEQISSDRRLIEEVKPLSRETIRTMLYVAYNLSCFRRLGEQLVYITGGIRRIFEVPNVLAVTPKCDPNIAHVIDETGDRRVCMKLRQHGGWGRCSCDRLVSLQDASGFIAVFPDTSAFVRVPTGENESVVRAVDVKSLDGKVRLVPILKGWFNAFGGTGPINSLGIPQPWPDTYPEYPNRGLIMHTETYAEKGSTGYHGSCGRNREVIDAGLHWGVKSSLVLLKEKEGQGSGGYF